MPTLREAFVAGCEVPPRDHHDGIGNADDSTLLVMPAWSGAYMGIKLVSVFPGNNKRGQPALNASYLLCDADTGEHLALIDGDQITQGAPLPPRRWAHLIWRAPMPGICWPSAQGVSHRCCRPRIAACCRLRG